MSESGQGESPDIFAILNHGLQILFFA